MSDKLRESISALVDGEASEMDLHRVLKATESDLDSRELWRRYHTASSLMRKEDHGTHQFDISASVKAVLADDKNSGANRLKEMFKPMMSVAVAATVTVAILTGTQVYQVAKGGGNASLQEVAKVETFTSAAPVVAGQFSNLALPAALSSQPYNNPKKAQTNKRAYADVMAEQRLHSYMYRHIENSALNTGSGVMPFARISKAEGK